MNLNNFMKFEITYLTIRLKLLIFLNRTIPYLLK